ncbi:(Fe-S)-binding protein [Pseudalkalibacillus caeni]|uniref:Glycolate oxidase iron-sulfur subunit n=1 Tax=Exobacillus caeni TaxID=2574798 RepID=A0A5R9F606_9BACL|nr:(Fe-S)-binding protein [Pseudalkalibacillus caeni]TLS38461.1 (Fe-S)-binding protein [Pseudalkalibacillus caeni]
MRNIENYASEVQQELKERLDYDELMNCMRCGFCLPSCPTYTQTNKNEAASPRGRIALMKGVVDGVIEPDEDFEEQLNLCLGCRACEPVCPSGVKYGHLLEEARDVLEQKKKHKWPVKVMRHLVFEEFFPKKDRIRRLNNLLWLYQKSGVQKVVQKSKVLNVLPGNLANMESILPEIPAPKEMKNRPEHLDPFNVEAPKKRVAFFAGCLMDTMFMPTNDATVKLLQLAGCEVFIPPAQGCCGALHAHSGEKNGAKELAKQNIRAFEELDVDYIISNAGGCGAFLIDYDHLLKDDPEWYERAKAFVLKTKDISEVLVELDFHEKPLAVQPQVVTYQDSCHLRNVMRTSSAPRKLLKSIEGVTFKEMKDPDQCCGSAGVYNIVQQDMSMQILDSKMEKAKATQAQTIVTANPGCLLQMKLGIKREKMESNAKAVHIVDLLLEAYEGAASGEDNIREVAVTDS